MSRKTILQAQAEEKLASYFLNFERIPISNSAKKFSDFDVQQISVILRHLKHEAWSRVPRIYIVLRIINQLCLIDDFIDYGFNDMFFPFTPANLPRMMSSTIRAAFIQAQPLVFSQALDLEKGDADKHAYFELNEPLPFKSTRLLGKGSSGQVDLVVSLWSSKEYARKTLRRTNVFAKTKDDAKKYEAELRILKKLKHRHTVRLVGSYTNPREFGLIMDPVAEQNLATFLCCAAKSSELKLLLRTFYGCLSTALAFLHRSQIRHKDIKPENILIMCETVLFTDFGLSRDSSELSRNTTEGPTALSQRYCAPEVAAFEPRSFPSDIWSLGCVFLEMTTVLLGETVDSQRLFFKEDGADKEDYHCNEDAIAQWIFALELMANQDQADNQPLKWITSMLQADPRVRPAAKDLKQTIKQNFPRYAGRCCSRDDDEVETLVESQRDLVSRTITSHSWRQCNINRNEVLLGLNQLALVVAKAALVSGVFTASFWTFLLLTRSSSKFSRLEFTVLFYFVFISLILVLYFPRMAWVLGR